MMEHVKDAVLLNEFSDLILLRLAEMTISSLRTGRPLFPGIMEEPAFFRKYFQVWVQEALEERDRLIASQGKNPLE